MRIIICVLLFVSVSMQAENKLLFVDIDFPEDVDKIHALDLMKKEDYQVVPFTVYKYQDGWTKSLLTNDPGHGIAMLEVVNSVCLRCDDTTYIEMNKVTLEEFVSSESQFHSYLIFKMLKASPNDYSVVNLSWMLESFPWFSLFEWHEKLIAELIKQNTLLVVSAGNTQTSITENIAFFEDNECLFYSIYNIVTYLIDFPRLEEELGERFCSENNNMAQWALTVGLVDNNNKPIYTPPGEKKHIQKAYVAVNKADLLQTERIGTSQAAAFISGNLMHGIKTCNSREQVFTFLYESIDNQFDGYCPELHGRGVFRPKKFTDKLKKHCVD